MLASGVGRDPPAVANANQWGEERQMDDNGKGPLITRRGAITALGAMMGVAFLEQCGGSTDFPPTGTTPTDPTTPTTPLATYAVTGNWITPVSKLVPNADGRYLPYQLFIPLGASPSTPLPLVIHVNGAGQRGTNNGLGPNGENPARLITTGLGAIVDANKTTVPQAFYLLPMMSGGPDIKDGSSPVNGLRYARGFYKAVLQDVLALYNVDLNRIHLSGYSSGAGSLFGFATRYPKIAASLTLWDGVPTSYNLTNEQDPFSDILAAKDYPAQQGDYSQNTAARAAIARLWGDIPINYQHGAQDAGSYAGALPSVPSTQQISDYTARSTDPNTNPNIGYVGTLGAKNGGPSWFSEFAANGLTRPTTVAATTSPSPGYSPSLHSVFVPYSGYNHGALNTYAFGLNNPWWKWWPAKRRTDYT